MSDVPPVPPDEPGPTALPSVGARVLAFVAILVAGVCGLTALGILLVASRGSVRPRTRVLGEQVERSTTTTQPPATTFAPAPIASTPPSVAPHRTSPTTTSPPPPVTEQSDNVVSIDYRAAGGSAEASSERVGSNPPPPDRLHFELVLGAPAPDGAVTVRADLTDATDGPIRFPGGLDVSVSIVRDGQPWRTLPLRRREVTELAAHSQVSVAGSVVPDADGHYDLSGQVTVQYANS